MEEIFVRSVFPVDAVPRWTDGERYLLYNPVTGGTHLVDEVAVYVFDELNGMSQSKTALIHRVLSAFDTPDEEVHRHIELVIEQLCGFGLLIESR